MTNKLFAILLSLAAPLALGEQAAVENEYKFKAVKSISEALAVKGQNEAAFWTTDMLYPEWTSSQAGRYFPADIAPVATGLAAGGITLPAPKPVDLSRYKPKQASEFAQMVNDKNAGGRLVIEPKKTQTTAKLSPAQRLSKEQNESTMVQTVISGLIERPFSQLNLTTEKFATIVKKVDKAHYHFDITGAEALEALEQNHSSAKVIQPNTLYLLSVIDMRRYSCSAMKYAINWYYNSGESSGSKNKIVNDSIYVISDLSMNNPNDIANAEKFFGRRPDALLVQRVIYADHVLKGGNTIFAFFAEGDKTRVSLVANLGVAHKLMNPKGNTGSVTRGYILDGIKSTTAGAAAANLAGAADAVGNLFSGTKKDSDSTNKCDKGMAMGLVKFSQNMFNDFANYMLKN